MLYINELTNSINYQSIKENNYSFDVKSYNDSLKKIIEEYDKAHEPKINSSNYKQMSVDGKNYIISNDGVVLEQDKYKNMGQLANDFENKKNEMIGAKGENSLVNANEAFNIMKKEMEESNFILIDKVDRNKISSELVQKIEFVKNIVGVNYNDFRVDINRGIFINTKDNELYEVRYDNVSKQYRLYRGKQATYNDNNINKDDNMYINNSNDKSKLSTYDLALFSDEELMKIKSSNIPYEKLEIIKKEIKRREEEKKELEKSKINNNVKKRVLTKDRIVSSFENGYVSNILVVVFSSILGIFIATIMLKFR